MNSLSFLAQEAPGFALRGSQVRVIREPSAFYQVRAFSLPLFKLLIKLNLLYNVRSSWIGRAVPRSESRWPRCTWALARRRRGSCPPSETTWTGTRRSGSTYSSTIAGETGSTSRARARAPWYNRCSTHKDKRWGFPLGFFKHKFSNFLLLIFLNES